MVDGFARLNNISWDAYNESSDLIWQVESYKEHFGYYPEAVIGDPIYGTKANRGYLKERSIRYCGKPLGRPRKQTEENREELQKEKRRRKQEYKERIVIEGKFGQGKNGYRLNLIKAKLRKTSESWIACIFFVMNIVELSSKKINSFFYFLSKVKILKLKSIFIKNFTLNPI